MTPKPIINLDNYIKQRESQLQNDINQTEDNILNTEDEINNYVFADTDKLIQDAEVYRKKAIEQQDLLATYQQQLANFQDLQTQHQNLANHYQNASWKWGYHTTKSYYGWGRYQDQNLVKLSNIEQKKANIYSQNASTIQKLVDKINQQISALNNYADVIENANKLFASSEGEIEESPQLLSVIEHQNNLYNEIEKNYFQQAELIELQRFQNQNSANWHNSQIRKPVFFNSFGRVGFIGWQNNPEHIGLRNIAQSLANEANNSFKDFQNIAQKTQQESNDLSQLTNKLETRLYEHFPAFKEGIQAEIAAYLIQWQNQQNLQFIDKLDHQQQLELLQLRVEQVTADLNEVETELIPNQQETLAISQQRFEETRLQWQNILQEKIANDNSLQEFLDANSGFLSDSEKLELTQGLIENNQDYIAKFESIIENLAQQLALNYDENLAQQLNDYSSYIENLKKQSQWASFQQNNFDLLKFDSEDKSQINSLIDELNSLENQGIKINSIVLEDAINLLKEIKESGSNILTALDDVKERITLIDNEKNSVNDIFASLNEEYSNLSQLKTDKTKKKFDLEQGITNKNEAIETTKNNIAETKTLINKIQLELDNFNGNKVAKESEIASLEQTILATETNISNIQDLIIDKQAQLETLETANDDEIAIVNTEIASLQQQEQDLQNQLTQQQNSLKSLNQELITINENIADLNDKNSVYQQELDSLNQDLLTQQGELTNLEESLAEVNQLLIEVSNQLSDTNAQIEVNAQYLYILESEFNRLSIPNKLFDDFSELEEQFEQDYNELELAIKTTKNAIQSLVNIRQQGEDERNQIDYLQSQLNDLETQLNDEITNTEESQTNLNSAQQELALTELQLETQELHLQTLTRKTTALLTAETYFYKQANYYRLRIWSRGYNQGNANAYQDYLDKASITKDEYNRVIAEIDTNKQKIADLEAEKIKQINQLNDGQIEVNTSNAAINNLRSIISNISTQIEKLNLDLEPLKQQEIESIETLFSALEYSEYLSSNLEKITQQQVQLSNQLIQLGMVASESDINFFEEKIKTRIEQFKSGLESRNQEFTTQIETLTALITKWEGVLETTTDDIVSATINNLINNIQQQQEILTVLQLENTATITNLETELAEALSNLKTLRQKQEFLVLQELENNQQRQEALQAQLATEEAVNTAINSNITESFAQLNKTLSETLKDSVNQWTSNLESGYLETQELEQVKQAFSQSFDNLIIKIKTQLADVQGEYKLNTTQLEEALHIVDVVIDRQDILAESVDSTKDAINIITKQLEQAEELQEKIGHLANLYELENDYQILQKSKIYTIEDVIDLIKTGQQFIVAFDKATFDDSGYTGTYATDPIGNLKAGESYQVTYNNGAFSTTGYNEYYKRAGIWTNSNANLDLGKISLWGLVFDFDSQGNIYDSQYGLVGTLHFDNVDLKPENEHSTIEELANKITEISNTYNLESQDIKEKIQEKLNLILQIPELSLEEEKGKIYDLETFDSIINGHNNFSVSGGGWSSQNTYPRHLADVNGDGLADIVGFAGHSVHTALAKGDGTFGNMITAHNNFTVSGGGWSNQNTYPRHLADVNGDGLADIVGFAGHSVHTALAKGDGTFGNMITAHNNFTVSGGGWSNQNTYPRHLADVNGDGLADIVGFGSGSVAVALAKGDGTFASHKVADKTFTHAGGGWTSQDRYPRHLADVNGDGLADIVGFGSSYVYTALAKGDGTFENHIVAHNEFTVNGGGWSSQDRYPRQLADVNGDGLADIVGFASSGVHVALANGDGTFGNRIKVHNNFSVKVGGWGSQNAYPRHLADVNGDGFVDIIGFGSGGVAVALSNVENKRNEAYQKAQTETVRQLQALFSEITNPLLIQELVQEINEFPNRHGLESEELQAYIQKKTNAILQEIDKQNETEILRPAGKVLSFDGVNDYINAGIHQSLEVSTNLTLEAWIKPSANSSTRIIAGREGEYLLSLSGANNNIYYAIANGNPGWKWVNTGHSISSHEWTHIAFTYENGLIKLYDGGELVYSYDGSGAIGDTLANLDEFHIGNRQYRNDNFFTGEIDEVRVWNITRTQEEIQTNLSEKLTGKETGLVGYWNFEEEGNSVINLASTLESNILGTRHGTQRFVDANIKVHHFLDEQAILDLQTLRLELAYLAIKSQEEPEIVQQYIRDALSFQQTNQNKTIENVISLIKAGNKFTVNFDKATFDDSGYTGSHKYDPMGNLKAGESYQVTYNNSNFSATGYNEYYKRNGTWTYNYKNLDEAKISLWGRIYDFDLQGNVYDPLYGLVGTLSFNNDELNNAFTSNILSLQEQYFPRFNDDITAQVLNGEVADELLNYTQELEDFKNSVTQKGAASTASLIQANWYEEQAARKCP